MHNIVNDELGKRKISYAEFNQIYMENKVEEKKKTNFSMYMVLCLVIILIILFVVYKKV
jgi:predicted nucleic acid-binding Zn ribbon protein